MSGETISRRKKSIINNGKPGTLTNNTTGSSAVQLNTITKKYPYINPGVATVVRNQEELIMKEKEAKKAAKAIAAKEIAAILTNPEQLSRVEQLRDEQNDFKRTVEASLKNLMKSKLDDVQSGLKSLDTSMRSLKSIENGYNEIRERGKEVASLIPRDEYELIQDVNIARNNLLQTKAHLEGIIQVPSLVAVTRRLMADDINILEVHKRVKKLQKVRKQILDAASPHPKEKLDLEKLLSNVVCLGDDFIYKLNELTVSHFRLATERPEVLIKVLQVFHREYKYKEFSLSRARRLKASAANRVNEKVLNREIEEIEEKPIIVWDSDSPDLVAKAKEWIQQSTIRRFETMFSDCKDNKGRYDINMILNNAKDKLFTDLTLVYDELRPCFPPFIDIFNMYCATYHACMHKVILSLSDVGIPPEDLLELAKWITTFYDNQMLRLGANRDSLQPPLTESLGPLIQIYANEIRKIMTEWALRVIDQDLDESSKKIVDDRYYTTAPTNLFTIVHQRLDVAVTTVSTEIILATSQQIVYTLKSFQEEMAKRIRNNGFKYDIGYAIALVNNFSKCVEETVRLQSKLEEITQKLQKANVATFDVNELNLPMVEKGFQELVMDARKLLVEQFLSPLQDELSQLFTKPWQMKNDITLTIVDTLADYFNNDLGNHISSIYHKKLISEVLDKVVHKYAESMFTKKLSFSKEVVERLNEDINLLQQFCLKKTEEKLPEKQVKRKLKLLTDLKSLASDDPHKLPKTIESILENNRDFNEEMALYIVDNREDLSRKEKGIAVDEIKKSFQLWKETNNQQIEQKPLPQISSGIFKDLKLPGGFFDNIGIGKT